VAAVTPSGLEPGVSDAETPIGVPMPCNLCGSTSPSRVWPARTTWVVRCSDCGLRFISPRVGQLVESEAYFRELYLPLFEGQAGEMGRRAMDFQIGEIETLVPVGTLLDVGSATGEYLRSARDRGWRCVGVERSPWAADYGRDHYGLDVRTGDLTDIDLPLASFDAVLMVEVVEHLEDPKANLARVAELLRPGGVLWLTTPNVASLAASVLGPRWDRIEPNGHLYYFAPESLTRLLEGAGLELLSLRTSGIDGDELLQRARQAGVAGSRLQWRLRVGAHRNLLRLRALRRTGADRLDPGRHGAMLGETLIALARRRQA